MSQDARSATPVAQRQKEAEAIYQYLREVAAQMRKEQDKT